MAKKKEEKKMTKDQAEKKILTLKKDLLNIRFKIPLYKIYPKMHNIVQIKIIVCFSFHVWLFSVDEWSLCTNTDVKM